MRRTVRLIAVAVLGAVLALPLPLPQARAQGAQPPHAWLFGAWTGGLFPVNGQISAQACLTQPVVIFTRDVVLRATLTDPLYTQRLVETARAIAGGTEFRFTGQPPQPASSTGLLGLTQPQPLTGFGCENPDVLHVTRRTENEISFPGCNDFPYPLVRCPGR